ncbi:glycosyltransferase family 25 protein [Grimontia sp. S25]|uniref:Glycosyltransferase family 25 protein n=1 Tax=Grimontia sedimenti TaxID=2711294 RepID=A0A6M1RT79_9GAMM|nr:glycosyltransferase family 25 protein [Grimontia sedimenti]NGN99187.1 glycosyltransferase family 25 protein [Grimontia sedimenti]
MKVYVLSLARSCDRRERMKLQLDKAGVEFEFFDAIDGSSSERFTHSEKAAPQLTFKRKGYFLRPNEVACFASHYSLWEKCIELDTPILILEDNVDIDDIVSTEVLDEVMNYASKYGYIKLSSTFQSAFTELYKLSCGISVGQFSKKSCGTTAYILSPLAAQKFVKNAKRFIEPVDDYMEKPWRHGVKTYSVHPSLFERANIPSTISSDSKSRKHKVQVGLFSKLYRELFRIHESIARIIFWKHR